MKTISDALKAHLSGNPTTLAWIWEVVRTDGTVMGFTTHDKDIPYDAGDGNGTVTYYARTGFGNTASKGGSDLSIDNLEVTAFLDSDSIKESDLRAGVYDDAVISIRIVNWSDLTQGHLTVRVGTLGIVKMQNGMATAEIRGLTYKLGTVIGSLYGPICRAQFGSGLNGIDMNSQWLCMVDVTTYAQNGSVNTAADALTILPTTGLLQVGSATPSAAAPAGWFDDGILTFTSGVLNGFKFEIRTWDATTLKLYLPMPAPPAHGDTFSIEPGCNHTVFDCNNKFANIVNFRGEPQMPGMDAILDYPNAV